MFAVGGGTDSSNRMNLFQIDNDGKSYFANDLNVDTSILTTNLYAAYVYSNTDTTEHLHIGNASVGYWFIEEDASANLNVHGVLNRKILLSPND